MNKNIKKIPQFRTEERIKKIENVMYHRHKDFTIVAENIADPHNVSAVFRSCDAVGILEAHIVNTRDDIITNLSNTSSASAKKWVNAIYHNSIQECYAQLRNEGKLIYTTHLSEEAVSIYDIDLTIPFALVLGNEHSGVSEEALAGADKNILIPQVGMIQSLNISVACAVSIYEAFRQRKASGKFNQIGLPEAEYEKYLNEFLEK